jgi:glycosyltransferase involved in cell wall biosynthesis
LEFWPQYAEDFYKPAERISEAEIPDDGVCNLVFAGNIGFAQGLGLLPKAADKLREKGVVVRFVIIGDGRYMPTLRNDISDLKVEDYFLFIDRKPAEEMPAYLAAADALLITLSKNDVFSITIPAKTQSCLACGRPIIVSADGEVQQIIKEANAGLVSDSEDVDGFVDNVIALSKMSKEEREELGKNALAYSKANFDKEELLNRIDQILQSGFNVN